MSNGNYSIAKPFILANSPDAATQSTDIFATLTIDTVNHIKILLPFGLIIETVMVSAISNPALRQESHDSADILTGREII